MTPPKKGLRRLTKAEKVQVLKRARSILRRPRGWTRHTLRSLITIDHATGEKTYGYCAIGALKQATIELGIAADDDNWITGANKPLARRLGFNPERLIGLNDGARKRQEVIDALDTRIAALEAES